MVLARMVPGPAPDIGLGSGLASGEVRRSLSPRLLAVLAGQGTWSFAGHGLAESQLPPLQFPLRQFPSNQCPPFPLAAPDGTSSRAYQKAGVERESAGPATPAPPFPAAQIPVDPVPAVPVGGAGRDQLSGVSKGRSREGKCGVRG